MPRDQPPIDDMEAYWSPMEKAHASRMLAYSFAGSPQTVQRNLERAGLLNGFLRVRDGQELLDCLNSKGDSHQQTLAEAAANE